MCKTKSWRARRHEGAVGQELGVSDWLVMTQEPHQLRLPRQAATINGSKSMSSAARRTCRTQDQRARQSHPGP